MNDECISVPVVHFLSHEWSVRTRTMVTDE